MESSDEDEAADNNKEGTEKVCSDGGSVTNVGNSTCVRLHTGFVLR